MKAVQITSYGDSSHLEIHEIDMPQVGPHQVLVKIYDAGVNPVDWKIREGHMKTGAATKFPLTMGQDFAGEILATGTEAMKFSKGDRVFGFAHGAYAEYAAIDEDKLSWMPPTIDYAQAAAVPTPGVTAYQIITEHLKPTQGQNILIIGAAGAVGSFAVQFARHKGAHVIAVASLQDGVYLKRIGASQIIDYKTEKFEQKVSQVDAVIDLVGGESLQRAFQVVKENGIVLTTVGPMNQDLSREKNVRGVQFVMHPRAQDLEEIARLIAAEVIQLHVSEILPLERVREAQDLNQKGKSHGKVILQMT